MTVVLAVAVIVWALAVYFTIQAWRNGAFDTLGLWRWILPGARLRSQTKPLSAKGRVCRNRAFLCAFLFGVLVLLAMWLCQ